MSFQGIRNRLLKFRGVWAYPRGYGDVRQRHTPRLALPMPLTDRQIQSAKARGAVQDRRWGRVVPAGRPRRRPTPALQIPEASPLRLAQRGRADTTRAVACVSKLPPRPRAPGRTRNLSRDGRSARNLGGDPSPPRSLVQRPRLAPALVPATRPQAPSIGGLTAGVSRLPPTGRGVVGRRSPARTCQSGTSMGMLRRARQLAIFLFGIREQ